MIAYLYQLDCIIKDNNKLNEQLALLSKEIKDCIQNLTIKDENNIIKCSSKIITYNNFLCNIKSNFLVDSYEVCLKKDSHKVTKKILIDNDYLNYNDSLDNQKIKGCIDELILINYDSIVDKLIDKLNML